jgi:DNA-binding transcriptional LysR family regulator
MDVGHPSLDQLRLFLAVADEGSFNAAARKLGRAISVVSYGIANLENQLGVTLFAREGSRKPELTDAGKALLAEARTVADDVDALLAKVRSLHQGLEAELTLAMDVMAPNTVVASVLREFQRMFPTVTLRLYVEALGAIGALVLDGRCTLGFGGDMIADLPELSRQRIGSVELIPVAAPNHPLAKAEKLEPGETRKHLQLVLTDRSPLTAGREFSVVAARTWRLADLGAKHALLREGIGWGNMPKHMVAADLQRGELVELNLPEHTGVAYQLNALWRRDAPLGPAACWMLDAFREHLEQECAAFTGK